MIRTGLYSLINFPCQATFHVNQLFKFVNQLSIYFAQLIATLRTFRLVFSLSTYCQAPGPGPGQGPGQFSSLKQTQN